MPLDLLTLKVVSESRVKWAGYLFGLPRPLCSRLRPDIRDRRQTETDVRQRQTKASLNAPPIRRGGITTVQQKYIQKDKN